MTDEQFSSWLKTSSAIRCVLVEVKVKTGGVETTRFLSNRGYVTQGSDIPSNTHYAPVIAGGIRFTESLALDGKASLSFGDIEIYNTSGEFDSWLDDVWSNRDVSVLIGDIRWKRSDFRQIFSGVVVGIDTKSRTRLNLKLGDKLQRLNQPVTETKLGGATTNSDKLIPLCFGECHNIEPILVDHTVNEYQVHAGPIERIIEVRDNGVPVQFTPLLSTGKFRLAASPAGEITASVQGNKPTTYDNDIASIIKTLVKDYGHVDQRFSDSDIDLDNFSEFKVENPQPVGLYLKDRANVLECCTALASSVGGRVTMSRLGKLTLRKVSLPRTNIGTVVTQSDILEKSLSITQMPTVVAGVKLGYCKNFTPQTNLQTGIPANHMRMYADEWLTVTRTSSVAAQDYITYTEPELQETLLLTSPDAIAEANRRLAMWSTQRTVFKYEGLPHLMLEELGDSQTLKHPRFGLEAGVTGQIISLSTDWINPSITVEVLV